MNVHKTQIRPIGWVRGLQRKLYLAAKERPGRGFGVLYDKVCRAEVLMEAWKRVAANHGGCGVDGMTIRQIREEYGVGRMLDETREELEAGKYRPAVIRRVYIPKDNGAKRPLGIPTVKDRVVQMAVKLVIEPLYEADFLEGSYGFRPKRSNQQAVKRVHELANGLKWIVDIDLKSYFDTINHVRLMELVRKRLRDPQILALIRWWLKAGIMENGKLTVPDEGTPQGGVLSPLLSNIYLHEFDRQWPRRLGFLVRFADDMVIMCKTREEAVRALRVVREIMTGLKLRLNEEKTSIRHAGEGFDFLGFTFKEGYSRKWNRKVMVKFPRKKSRDKLKRNLKKRLKKIPLGKPLADVIKEINPVIRGWVNYFRIGNSYAATVKVAEEACRQLRIFWRKKKQDKRCQGYRKWTNQFFYDRGLVYAPALI
jgi:group II intron reverse transcriptase/maturase